jgi:predicted transcriptional regulator
MSNVLKVSLQTTIYSLAQRGWSQRRIAKELGINRETVSRYLRLPKPAISTAGFEDDEAAKPAISITGNLAGKEESKPAISIAGIGAGRRSRCEALAEVRRRATVGVETWIPPEREKWSYTPGDSIYRIGRREGVSRSAAPRMGL